MCAQHLSEKLLDELGLPESLMAGVREAGFVQCTPIQAESLPLALTGRDIAGQAQTGTGKTAAFLLAAFNHLLKHSSPTGRQATQPRAMILAPTRELAVQIHRDAELLGKYAGFRNVLVFGGTGYDSQRKALEAGVDILIGTPGRTIDYFKQHVFDLKAIQVMVMDEADRMFDLGFIKDIRFLLRRMTPPEERLNMLFSATLSYRVTELAYEHMNDPEFIRIEPDKVTVDTVQQLVYHPANSEKIPLLVALLKHMDPTRSLVFTNTKGAAERVQAWLEGNGFHAQALTGDVPQNQRLRLLQDFQEGRLPIMVATDVAARGLHIPDVSHVFNFDLPQDPEDYVHRIGRTARAGKSGDAVSMACEEYAYSLMEIEQFIGHKIPAAHIEDGMLAKLEPPVKRTHRPRHGQRQRDDRARSSGRGRSSKGESGYKRQTRASTKSPERPDQAPRSAARPPGPKSDAGGRAAKPAPRQAHQRRKKGPAIG